MASLSLTNSEVVRAVVQIMGLGRGNNMDAATEADVRATIRAGLRRAFFPTQGEFTYQWRWLEKHASLNVPAVFESGTIAVSNGTVTLTGSTWPSWVEDGFISVDGHVLFITAELTTTTASTSNTQLVVNAGSTYKLYRYRYPLPADFGEWLGGVVYANGTESRMLAGSSESEIRLRYAVGQGLNARTTHFALTTTPDASGWYVMLWPVPEPNAFIQGTYLSVPDDNLPADLNSPGSVVQVAPIYADVFLNAILAAAEAYANDTAGIHEQRYQEALVKAIAHDRAVGGAYDFSRPLSRRADDRDIGDVLPVQFM